MRHWRYFTNLLRSGFALGILAGAIIFIAAYPVTDATPEELGWAAVLVVSVAAVTALLRKIKLLVWMSLTYITYAVGLIYALDLLFTPDVDGGYNAAVMTVSVFVLHGFAVGAFIELVTWLHRITGRAIDIFKEKTRLKLEDK